MATLRQKKVAMEIIDRQMNGKPLIATEILENAGYSPVTARASSRAILEGEGVKQELQTMQQAMGKVGITSEKVARKIDSLLERDDPNAVAKGIDFTMKLGLGGGYSPEKSIVVNANVEIADMSPEMKAAKDAFEAAYKKKLME